MREYIVPVANTDKTNEGMYIGFIRTRHELIRCKDCKYYGFNDWLHCPMTDSKADDYCSRAERKEE